MQPRNVNIRSAAVAGILGIFLGMFGAHNFYLGRVGRGLINYLFIIVPMLFMVASAAALSMSGLGHTVMPLFTSFVSISYVWALIESIIILKEGDAGLARKGYIVAKPKN